MAEADADCYRLVDRPADGDKVLHLGEAAVDDLGARRSRIAVSGMDAGAHAADGKGDVALQHFGFSGFKVAKFGDLVAFHGDSFGHGLPLAVWGDDRFLAEYLLATTLFSIYRSKV